MKLRTYIFTKLLVEGETDEEVPESRKIKVRDKVIREIRIDECDLQDRAPPPNDSRLKVRDSKYLVMNSVTSRA